jgi:hypothetical protein
MAAKTVSVRSQIFTAAFWTLAAIGALWSSSPKADEVVLANVISSTPYYGENQKYEKKCYLLDNGNTKCFLQGEKPKYYATTFTNGRVQFLILTKAQFPIDVWFEVTRDCSNDPCTYKRAVMSKYQSPETLAIDEIQTREQRRYINDPRRMY